jgi:nitrite reductase/ring-hydroxylating ferredoxin subunit
MRNSLYILIIPLLFLGCSKAQNDNIPLTTVNFTIYTDNPAYIAVSVPGSWMYINGGSRGILLYRASNFEFVAYDRHCTYDPNNNCGQVNVDASNIIARDDCCASEFLITDGSVIKNPASIPLKMYQTSFDGSILRIFN